MSRSHSTTIPESYFLPRRSIWDGTINRLFCVLAIAMLVSVLFVLLAFDVPPLQDYGDWTYQGYLLNRLLSLTTAPALLKAWPVPNSVSEVLLAVLGVALSPVAAARALIAAYLVACAVVMAVASRRDAHIDGGKLLLLLCLGVVHAPFWTGEINYQIGLLLFLTYVLHCRDRAPSTQLTAGYAILLFFCHAFCLGMLMIYEGWRSLLQRRFLHGFLSFVPALLLVIWYKLADPRTDWTESRPLLHGIKDAVGYLAYQVAKTGPYHNFVFGSVGDYERARLLYWIGSATNFVFAACMGVLMLVWIRACWRDRRVSAELLAALSFIGVAFFDPGSYLGVAELGERLIAPALILAVMSLRETTVFERLGAWLAALSIPVFVTFAVAGLNGVERGTVPTNDVVNDPNKRLQILFWHKPFAFAVQADAAEQSWVLGVPPTRPIGFETSLLLRPKEGKGAKR